MTWLELCHIFNYSINANWCERVCKVELKSDAKPKGICHTTNDDWNVFVPR